MITIIIIIIIYHHHYHHHHYYNHYHYSDKFIAVDYFTDVLHFFDPVINEDGTTNCHFPLTILTHQRQ